MEFISRPGSNGFGCLARGGTVERTRPAVTPRCTAFALRHSRTLLLPANRVSLYGNSYMLLFRYRRLQSDTLITSHSILSRRYRLLLSLPAAPLPANTRRV